MPECKPASAISVSWFSNGALVPMARIAALSDDLSGFASMRVYTCIQGVPTEAVPESSSFFDVQPVQGRKALASDGRHSAGQMYVPAHDFQSRVAQVLLQGEHVTAIDKKQGCIGVPE